MTLEEFVLEVMDRLEMAQGLAGVEICRSGTAAPRRCPPGSPLIAVGLGEMKFSQTAAGGDLDDLLAAFHRQLKNQEGLMFHGQPLGAGDIEKIVRAMRLGAELALRESKEDELP